MQTNTKNRSTPHHVLMRHMQSSNINIEGFGNTHEYEIWPDTQHPITHVINQGSYNNQRRIETEAEYQTGVIANEEQSYYRNMRDNNIIDMVDDIFHPVTTSVDDRMAKLMSNMERNAKKSMEYQSGVTLDKSRRYFEHELDMHEHREWWVDPDYSDKHLTW